MISLIRARARNRNRYSPRGFTLIELLIVVGILPIVTVSLAGMLGGLQRSHQSMERRIDAQEAATTTLEQWRRDVALAERLTVTPDGHAMRLDRHDPQGRLLRIDYALLATGAAPAPAAVPAVAERHEIPAAKTVAPAAQSGGFELVRTEELQGDATDSTPTLRRQVMAGQLADLTMEPISRGYGLKLSGLVNDGLRPWRWGEQGFATPLSPAPEGAQP